ncbi:hypothetical protein, partial [Phormidium sp. CCY1219]|uniref:hypothetical protein n=1 Tax=Phormidium sp. CCY1219 TaxID=2886104 RepID=UPI002D1EA7FF
MTLSNKAKSQKICGATNGYPELKNEMMASFCPPINRVVISHWFGGGGCGYWSLMRGRWASIIYCL